VRPDHLVTLHDRDREAGNVQLDALLLEFRFEEPQALLARGPLRGEKACGESE
jgi:hypothetical protein